MTSKEEFMRKMQAKIAHKRELEDTGEVDEEIPKAVRRKDMEDLPEPTLED